MVRQTLSGELGRRSGAHAARCTCRIPLIGHFQIRNRGTVGGSIAHADPASELPAAAASALGAEIEMPGPIRNPARSRLGVLPGTTWETAVAPG